MGDLQPIIDVIIEDGEKKAKKILENAKAKAEHLYTDFELEQTKKRESFEKSMSEELERIYSAQNVRMRQLAKTALLEAKAKAVKKAAMDAASAVADLPDEKYFKFMENLYKKIDYKNSGIIYLNQRDKKRIKEEIFGTTKIADKCINSMGGFVLEAGEVRYDCTIEAILEERYSEICDAVNQVYMKGDAS